MGSSSISEEAWATLMEEDQSFDYETKGVGRDVVSGTEIPYDEEEVTGAAGDDEHTS